MSVALLLVALHLPEGRGPAWAAPAPLGSVPGAAELTLIGDKPTSVDLLCASKASCDSRRLTYFHALYISRPTSVQRVVSPPTRPTSHATIGPAGGRDSVTPYTHQGGSII